MCAPAYQFSARLAVKQWCHQHQCTHMRLQKSVNSQDPTPKTTLTTLTNKDESTQNKNDTVSQYTDSKFDKGV